MNDASLAAKMLEALNAEHSLYRLMLECSRKQVELLEQTPVPVEVLARLMSDKMELAMRIEHLEQENRVIKSDWEQHYQAFSAGEREPLAALRNEMMDTLGEIQQLETTIADGIRRCEDELNRELVDIRKHKTVSQAYINQPGPQRPHYFDKKK